eukprot:TRINITY_DN2286_c0_g1_i1.p1 TRINITY_DN2286_c0_g1~~TRINITY_DN2286_c0_g1_i1.p1  ORF type:complete len:916 (+),score=253.09 TRINITY_DN2286_c0_g1_i1:260-2749(+)
MIVFHVLKYLMDRDLDDRTQLYIELEEYRSCGLSGDALAARAWAIYDKYVRPESPNEVEFPAALRESVAKRLSSPAVHMFDPLQDSLMGTVKSDIYPRLFKSTLFNMTAAVLQKMLPAPNSYKGTIDSATALLVGRTIYNLMQRLDMADFEVNSQDPVADDRHADPVGLRLMHALRLMLLFPAFVLFSEKELASENLFFFLEVDVFKLIRRPDALKQRAQAIFNRYCKLGSDAEINLPDRMRESIQVALANPTTSMYDTAQAECLNLMRLNAYSRFKKSEAFTNFSSNFEILPDLYILDIERRKRDDKFREKFELSESECIITEVTASLEKKVTLHGNIYVGRDVVCFFAYVFGFRTKETFHFSEILSIDTQQADDLIFTLKDRTFSFFNLIDRNHILVVVRKCWLAAEMRAMVSVAEEEERDGKSVRPHHHAPDEEAASVLTEKDFQLFQEGAKVVTYSKDQVVLREAESSRSLFQIARGKVRIEKNGQSLRVLEEGSMFGEMSFLEGGVASASVVAHEDKTSIYIIEGTFIESLLKVEPGLPGRFYRALAMNLAERLKTKKVGAPAAGGPTASVSVDAASVDRQKFDSLFGFGKDEPLIAVWETCMERKMKHFGRLYLSKNYLSFTSKVLGMKTREVFLLKEITTVTAAAGRLEIVLGEKDRLAFIGFEKLDEVAELLHTAKAKADSGGVVPGPVVEKTSRGGLSKQDFDLLLTGAKLVSYERDMAIMAEGSVSSSLYQLARGSVRVEKGQGDDRVVLRRMGPGVMFGELSFLQGGAVTASICADDDGADVYVIEQSFVESLLDLDPELPGRFYKFLAINLANRLRK